MLMKILILLVMIAWLVASLPQTRFIWVPDYNQSSFDWWAANIRAVIIDFLPLAVIFVESQLIKRHRDRAERSFKRRSDKDELDFEVWEKSYPSTERSVAKQMPLLFLVSTLVISISYWAYYTEFGREMALYKLEFWGLKIGGPIRFLVLVVYLTISMLFTYGWGKLMSAFEVHTLFDKPIKRTKKPSTNVEHNVEQPPERKATKTIPCEHCGSPLKVGPDGTTRQAWAGHKRWCAGFNKVSEQKGDF